MAKFLTELGVVGITDKIWVLTQPLVYQSDLIDTVAVPVGFHTDFASVPRVPVFYTLFGDRAHREAVIHDYLYMIDAFPEVSRKLADRVFLEAMIVRSKPFWTRQAMYWGVRLGGWTAYHKKRVGDKL